MPKCIAIVGKARCANPAQTEGEWPQTSLCQSHWGELNKSDVKDGDGGKGFDTVYEYNKKNVGLCRDKSRKNFKVGNVDVSEYYFCDPNNSDRNKYLDECLVDVPASPRLSPASPRPGSPRPLATAYGASLSPTMRTSGGHVFTCVKPTNRIEEFKKQLKKKDKSNDEEESSSESETESSSESEAEEEVEESKSKRRIRNRLPPDLNDMIQDKKPYYSLKDLEKHLRVIDTTRNSFEALQEIQAVMNDIDKQLKKDDSSRTANTKYTYTVKEKVVNEVAKDLSKYMDNPDRIELVLIFLFDYESRDLFEQMKFYGFSNDNGRKSNELNLLTGTPYDILMAGKPGYGDINPSLAKPRQISEIFSDKIERIKDTFKEKIKKEAEAEAAKRAAEAAAANAARTQQQQQRSGAQSQDGSLPGGNPRDGRPGGAQPLASDIPLPDPSPYINFINKLGEDKYKNLKHNNLPFNAKKETAGSLKDSLNKEWTNKNKSIANGPLNTFLSNALSAKNANEMNKEVSTLLAYIRGQMSPAPVSSGGLPPAPT